MPSVGTLRLKMLKVGAVILRNTRRIRFLLSSACPYQRLFFHVAARLAPGKSRQLLIQKRVETTAMDSYAYAVPQ